MVEIEVKNLDEAAYYYFHGADFITVRERKLQERYVPRKPVPYVWIITMGNVEEKDIEIWRQDEAQVPVPRYMIVRDKLKRKIKQHLRI